MQGPGHGKLPKPLLYLLLRMLRLPKGSASLRRQLQRYESHAARIEQQAGFVSAAQHTMMISRRTGDIDLLLYCALLQIYFLCPVSGHCCQRLQ